MGYVTTNVQGGVAILTVSNPPVNALHPKVLQAIADAHAAAVSNPSVKAIVLTGKKMFIAGADIAAIQGADIKTFESYMWLGHKVLDGIEAASKPTVAAIDGVALGGGLELAMACHARVATPKAKLGLPELQLGIIPGYGGTQRLPRLVGVARAMEMMLKSKPTTGAAALKEGLVAVVAPNSGALVPAAVKLALDIAAGRVARKESLKLNDKVPPPAKVKAIIAAGRKMARAKTGGRVKFPDAALDAIETGLIYGPKAGARKEIAGIVTCFQDPAAKALIHTFFSVRAAGKLTAKPSGPVRKFKAGAVLGGGLMGSGIATAMLLSGMTVILKEINDKFLQAGIKRVEGALASLVRSKKVSAGAAKAARARLTPTLTYDGFDKIDIVIEAAIENVKLKQMIFQQLEAATNKDCVLATNTSTIDIPTVAGKIPGSVSRVIGLHFFSPAHLMPLLEIVRHPELDPAVLAACSAFGKSIRKTCIIVTTCPGFTVNRMFFPYLQAGEVLINNGYTPYDIDPIIAKWGMPSGPFRLADLVGLDVVGFVNDNLNAAFGDRSYPPLMLRSLTAAKRLGEKNGLGFYKHTKQGRKRVAVPDLAAIAPHMEPGRKKFAGVGAGGPKLTDEEILQVFMFPVVNEACRILDEGLVDRASDIDIGSIMGYGFPAWRGGIMHWADAVYGSATIFRKLSEFQKRFGSAFFTPCEYLQRAAASNARLSVDPHGPRARL